MLTASAKLLWNVSRAIPLLGVDPQSVLRRCELSTSDVETMATEGRRIPVALLDRFWASAVELTGDGALGVRVGALARLEMYGVVGEVVKASATLGDALLKTSRYLKFWNEATHLSLLV